MSPPVQVVASSCYLVEQELLTQNTFSRPISSTGLERCETKETGELVEVKIGYDAGEGDPFYETRPVK